MPSSVCCLQQTFLLPSKLKFGRFVQGSCISTACCRRPSCSPQHASSSIPSLCVALAAEPRLRPAGPNEQHLLRTCTLPSSACFLQYTAGLFPSEVRAACARHCLQRRPTFGTGCIAQRNASWKCLQRSVSEKTPPAKRLRKTPPRQNVSS